MSSNVPLIRLGDVVDRVTKGTTPTTHGYQYTQEGVAFVRVENLRNGLIDSSTVTTFISAEADRFLKRSSLEKDDVLVSIAGTIGRTAVVREQDLPANTNQAVAIIRGAGKRFDPVFLRYALESPLLNRLLTREARGGAMQNISLEDVKNVEVPVPTIVQQRAIVAEIEEQFTRLEAGVTGLRCVQAKLKRYRAAVLKAACEGKLVPTEAELAHQEGRTYETGAQLLERILTERRKKWSGKGRYKEPAKPDNDTVPSVPDGWTLTGFEQLSDGSRHAIKAGPFGSSLQKKVYTASGFKIYGQEQVINGDPYFGDYFIAADLYEQLKSCAVKPGDILISLVGTTGKVLILPENCAPGIINPRLLKLSLNRQGVSARYMKILLESPQTRAFFKRFAHGGTMEILNLGILKSLPITLPPLAEQQRIVAEVERRISVIEELEALVNANLQRSIRLRQSILQRAFEGRLFYAANYL